MTYLVGQLLCLILFIIIMQVIGASLPSSVLTSSFFSPSISTSRRKLEILVVKCSIADNNNNAIPRYVFSGLVASSLCLSQPEFVHATDLSQSHHSNNICQLSNVSTDQIPLPLDDNSSMMMMMKGMTAKNFDPVRYSGRWYEVASLKRGFAGQGQEDCHCTQGVYTFDMETPSILVDTFCVHGSPDGYITGIRGKVQCLSDEEKGMKETDLEKLEMVRGKCYLRFPTLPFIPKEPYDVIETDYDNFALVSGAKDRSFVQIYSRTPNPGLEFIAKYKAELADFGYDADKIKDTPQDCQAMSDSRLSAMMSQTGMQQALTNRFPDLELNRSVEFNPFTSVAETLKKLVELYFKQLKTPI